LGLKRVKLIDFVTGCSDIKFVNLRKL